MPPAWAMAMASGASVTVSMAAEINGMPSSMRRVRRVRVSTWPGNTLEAAGTSKTSSNVSASRIVKREALSRRRGYHQETYGARDAKFASSALAAVDGAEALVIATEWPEFANVDFGALKKRMTTPIVFDGRNLLNPETMGELGFHYHSIGRGSVIPR